MTIKRVHPVSAAKILGAVYAFFGLLAGAIFSIVAAFGGFAAENRFGGVLATVLGLGAIIFMPLFYGLMGLVVGLIGAWVYNIVAGAVGGIQIDIQ